MAGKSQALLRAGWHGLGRAVERLAYSLALPARRLPGRFERGMLDLLFPAGCLSCGAELADEERIGDGVPICPSCIDDLELFNVPMCAVCAAPLTQAEPIIRPKRGGCFHCAGRKLWFDRAIAVGRYAGRLRLLVLRMKRAEGDSLSLALGRLLAERRRQELTSERVDVVVPVPMHWRRRLSHGTNSAAVLAEGLAGRLQAPLATGLLRRCRNTPPQFSLSPPQRWENVRRAFSVRPGYHLKRAHVLLVDDILTSGATCSEAARALRKNGAQRVTVAVVARTANA